MTRTVVETRPPTRIRQAIAARLGQSYREAVHVSVRRSIGVDRAVEVVETCPPGGSYRVGLVDVVLAALAGTLVAFPEFNAIADEQGHHLVKEVNIGVAIDAPSGLVVPVLKSAETLTLDEIARSRRRLTDQVLSWTHGLEDLADGTFTVSNLGPLGVDEVDPIINPPQTAILGVGRIRKELEVDESSGELQTRRLATFSLVFDHRVHDGAGAARFLGGLATRLEDWDIAVSRKRSSNR